MNRLRKQAAIAGICLGAGLALLPLLIYFAGISLLGPYEGASLPHIYQSILGGLVHGSFSSWVVVLGPYFLFLLFRALGAWWHAGA
ncbi:MAG: hypothetical protein ABSF94_01905 [Steroidobacteraceae bacterium]